MKQLRVIVLLAFGAWVNASAATSDLTPAEKIAVSLAGDGKARRLSIAELKSYVGGNTEEVTAILRKVEAGNNQLKGYNLLDADARVALLKLYDRVTVEKILANFTEYRSGSLDACARDIVASAQPMLIQDLSALLVLPASAYAAYDRERVKHLSDVVTDSPVFLADLLIVEIVRDSDQFSAATREWATTMWRNSGSREEIRRILLAWWNNNKQLLCNGDFGSVQPGALPQEDKESWRS